MIFESFQKNAFLVLGRAGLDLYADPPGTEIEHATRFTAALGGSSGNIAAGIAKLGGHVGLLGVVSDDAVGRYTVNQLKAYGISTALVHAVKGEARNSLAVVETRAENCQSVIYRNNAADFLLSRQHVEAVDFAKFGVLILTGTSLAMEPSRSATMLAISMAREAGVAVVIDVDYRPYSWESVAQAAQLLGKAVAGCDMIVGNDVEFDVLAGGRDGRTFAGVMAKSTDKVVIYKMGEKGCVSFVGRNEIETPIFRVEALKPTGAGDSFLSAMVTALSRKKSLENAVIEGAASAAIVVGRVGCAPAMPTQEELAQFLSERTRVN